MDNIVRMIECWKQTKSVKEVMALNISIPDIKATRAAIQDWEAPARREAFKCLRDIGQAVSATLKRLHTEKEALDYHFHKAQINKKACLAYHKQTRFQHIHNKQNR